jgi:hypothetical protein
MCTLTEIYYFYDDRLSRPPGMSYRFNFHPLYRGRRGKRMNKHFKQYNYDNQKRLC